MRDERWMRGGAALLVGCLLLTACEQDDRGGADTTESTTAPSPNPPFGQEPTGGKEGDRSERSGLLTDAEAEADLESAEGKGVEGEVDFQTEGDGVRVIAEVEIEGGKAGMHGFHIHEKGDCSDIPGKSMGGHFAPEGHRHALPSEEGARHLGDLGNIEIDAEGEGELDMVLPKANLKQGDPNSLLGKAVVLHEGQDSGKAKQPSGGSGTPIACGVIQKD